jgi:hypothetical protein
MGQTNIIRMTCDRCGLSEDDPPPGRWHYVQLKNDALSRQALCPDCYRALERWMAKAKGDTAAAA